MVEDIEYLRPFNCRQVPLRRGSCNHLNQLETRAAILIFKSVRKNTNLVQDVEYLFPVKFAQIPFSGTWEKSKMSYPIIDQGGHLCFSISRKKTTNLAEQVGKINVFEFRFSFIKFHSVVSEKLKCEVNDDTQTDGRCACAFGSGALKREKRSFITNFVPINNHVYTITTQVWYGTNFWYCLIAWDIDIKRN